MITLLLKSYSRFEKYGEKPLNELQPKSRYGNYRWELPNRPGWVFPSEHDLLPGRKRANSRYLNEDAKRDATTTERIWFWVMIAVLVFIGVTAFVLASL